ncbi:MAG: MliC family protein [Rhizobiales bacterium]|nr:MliC family protein [Hyphomicrobiales bacterium]
MTCSIRSKSAIYCIALLLFSNNAWAQTKVSTGQAEKQLPSVAQQADIPEISEIFSYHCDTGDTLTVQFDNRAAETLAVIHHNDNPAMYLVQVISGSGSRYASDAAELHTKADGALLTSNEILHKCQLQ